MLAIDDAGILYAWGDNAQKQLATSAVWGNISSGVAPPHIIPVSEGKSIVDIAAGAEHSLGIRSDGRLYAVGSNAREQLARENAIHGTNGIMVSSTPIEIMCNVMRVAAGGNSTFVIDSQGQLWGWGDNSQAQLAQEAGNFDKGKDISGKLLSYTHKPQKITVDNASADAQKWTDVVVGAIYVLAMKADGSLWLWGGGTHKPRHIGSGTTWKAIAMGASHILAVDTTNKVWGWGLNTSGQLATATTTTSLNTLTQIHPKP